METSNKRYVVYALVDYDHFGFVKDWFEDDIKFTHLLNVAWIMDQNTCDTLTKKLDKKNTQYRIFEW